MIHRIYKYKLRVTDSQFVKMPCIWALVNPEVKETEDRLFDIFGTGHDIVCDIGCDRQFIGTF